jgi:UDP-MurNAc hydroxylase
VRATLIGHACWLMETTAGCFLTDPVLGDPFEEGTVTSCPQRVVHTERLPVLRGLFVSHRHLDHFDFPSLARLDRQLPVFCPDDPLVVYGLRHLGFTDLRLLQPFVPQHMAGLRILPTPSANRDVLEYGAVWQDETGSVFNQVDTFLTPETMARLQREVGSVDVHLAMYASQNFHFFESQRQHTAALYTINLKTALTLQARCVVPASAGFRFSDDLHWLNAHVFPIAREQFLLDLKRLNAALHTAIVNPGDRLVAAHGQVEVQPQAVDYVAMVADDTWRLRHDPTAPVPPLLDHNPSHYGLQGLHEFAHGLLETGLPQYLTRGLLSKDTLVEQYVQHGVVYQVEVVFPEALQRWTYCFDGARPPIIARRDATVPAPHMRHRITASALVDFCLGRRSYFYVRTQSRRASQVFQLQQTGHGVNAREVELPDILTHYIIHHMPGAERRGADWVRFVTKDLLPGPYEP